MPATTSKGSYLFAPLLSERSERGGRFLQLLQNIFGHADFLLRSVCGHFRRRSGRWCRSGSVRRRGAGCGRDVDGGLWLERGQSLARGRDFFGETGDDTTRGVVLIQRVGQFLTRRLQLLTKREGMQHDGVPFVLRGFLKEVQKGTVEMPLARPL